MNVVFVAVLLCSMVTLGSARNLRERPMVDLEKLREDRNRGEDNSPGRVRRTAVTSCEPVLWPEGNLCYYYDKTTGNSPNDKAKNQLNDAIAILRDVSCLTFEKLESSSDTCSTGVAPTCVIYKDDDTSGCSANIGCGTSLETTLALGKTCLYPGVTMHEMLHIFGFHHEQTRIDRDEFVMVNPSEIKDRKIFNYNKCTRDLLGIRYDYQSIMHYGDYSFRKPGGSDTMTALREDQQKKMGTQTMLSMLDIQRINTLYSCYPDDVDLSVCQNGGMLKASGTCACVDPFRGIHCELSDAYKKYTIETIGTIKEVPSPNYKDGKHYDINSIVWYVFECLIGKPRLTFIDFEIEGYGCGYDKVNLYEKGDVYPQINCDKELKGVVYDAYTPELRLELVSDDLYTYNGFDISFECVGE